MAQPKTVASGFFLALVLAGCQPASDGSPQTFGPDINLGAPEKGGPIPTINVPKSVGWKADEKPTVPEGFVVNRFAEGLIHPRWLYELPNGDILVAEASSKPTSAKGIEALVANSMQKRAGAYADGANSITLLRDADGDGKAEVKQTLIDGLSQPFGMALVGPHLYVANTDAIIRFDYAPGSDAAPANPVRIVDLPHSASGHWTRNLLAAKDGKSLYVTVGSASNIGDAGMQAEQGRAMIHRLDLTSGKLSAFATGLRNANGLAIEPVSGELWTTVNERDMLGNDLVPDYMTSVRAGDEFGWPWSYFGKIVDDRVQPQNPAVVARARKPDYALGAHTASLGLAFYTGNRFPADWQGGAFIGQHGSWNRKPVSGYKVIFVPFAGGKPSGLPKDFMTGFLNDEGEVRGRPVGVIMDSKGALLVADDNGKTIWRAVPKG